MAQYKFNGSTPVSIPALGLELQPGQVFETDEEINHSDFDLIKTKPKADAPAKEA